ncbi:hypothetical protein DFAR_320018 [Desulfarculales bacterium]
MKDSLTPRLEQSNNKQTFIDYAGQIVDVVVHLADEVRAA